MTILYPELRATGFENHVKNEKEKEKKEAERKRIKKERKLVEERFLHRKAVYRDGQPEVYEEGSILSKLTRQGDYDGATLVGEILATLTMHFFQLLFATQYLIQQREFSEAQQIDRAKEQMLASGQATDDNFGLEPLRDPSTNFETVLLDAAGNPVYPSLRLAYEPLRDPSDYNKLLLDGAGNPVWPKIYPITNGQVDYNRAPIMDGSASRYAIRMNGFVPKEDFKESYEIQLLKLNKDFGGASGFTNAQRAKLQIFAEQQGQKAAKGMKDDANSMRAATNRPVPVSAPSRSIKI